LQLTVTISATPHSTRAGRVSRKSSPRRSPAPLKRFPSKPLWIAETGCASTGGDKVEWLRDMDAALRGPLSKVESVTWFEAAKEADWRMMSSAQSATNRQTHLGTLRFYRRGEG
jgi:hypothetical protein